MPGPHNFGARPAEDSPEESWARRSGANTGTNSRIDRARTGRSPVRGRRRPNLRAALGALLITGAVVAVLSLADSNSEDRARTVVVATRPLTSGEILDPADLGLTMAGLDEDIAANAFTSIEELAGAAMLAPLGSGEILQRSAVLTDPDSLEGATEFSFPIDAQHAMNGDLRPGETIDLLATFGSNIDATTSVLARDLRIIRSVVVDGSSFETGTRLSLTVALPVGTDVLTIVHATRVAELTAIRTTGTRNSTILGASTSSPVGTGGLDPLGSTGGLSSGGVQW